METNGDGKSNNSQFYITLKATPHLNRTNVVFGQLIGGMDIIRQIARVPCDINDRPRVPIVIVACGQIGDSSSSSSKAAILASGLDRRALEAKMSLEAARKYSALRGIESKIQIQESHNGDASTSENEDDDSKDEEISGLWSGLQSRAFAKNSDGSNISNNAVSVSTAGRLKNLERLINASRRQNEREVVEEQKQQLHGSKGLAWSAAKREKEIEEELLGFGRNKEVADKRKKTIGGDLMNETAVASDLKAAKRARKMENERFGWDVFNPESTLRAHEKRIKDTKFDSAEYAKQMKLLAANGVQLENLAVGNVSEFHLSQLQLMHNVDESRKETAAEFIESHRAKKEDFSRRRAVLGEEDVTYINKRNEVFNKKLDRAYGDHTREIKQNLERGTAL